MGDPNLNFGLQVSLNHRRRRPIMSLGTATYTGEELEQCPTMQKEEFEVLEVRPTCYLFQKLG